MLVCNLLSAWLTSALLPQFARVGDGWGTNIHYTAESVPGETAMLAKAFKIARTDLKWSAVEAACGSYNFSAYDAMSTWPESTRRKRIQFARPESAQAKASSAMVTRGSMRRPV